MLEKSDYEVKCVVIDKTAGGEDHVAQIGGDGWQERLNDVVSNLDLGVTTYFTLIGGKRAEIHVVSPRAGDRFLRTTADDKNTNNLLELPRCRKVLPTGM